VGTGNNNLNGVATISGCRAWAVGFSHVRGGYRTLILYWNRKRWEVQRSPNPGPSPHNASLFSVAATSPTNAWAVGNYYNRRQDAYQTLIEHWDGTAWKVQRSPNPGSPPNGALEGVVATSSTNAWAVGNYSTSSSSEGLILHWDGKAWKVQPGPVFTSAGLSGVAATSTTNAWAVGGGGDYSDGTLVEHWDGKAWARQRSPNGASPKDPQSSNGLFGVAATSGTNAWAVGSSYSHFQDRSRVLITDWNGTAWRFHRSGTRAQYYFQALYGVAAPSPTHAWAVGFYRKGTLITRWDGKAWKIQRSPSPGPFPRQDVLYGVAATSPTNAWAVGSYRGKSRRKRTLALHWNGTAWGP
jgi:hypothetical protein